MKRMLAQKFIDWIKKAFQSILIQINGDDINVEIPGNLIVDGTITPNQYELDKDLGITLDSVLTADGFSIYYQHARISNGKLNIVVAIKATNATATHQIYSGTDGHLTLPSSVLSKLYPVSAGNSVIAAQTQGACVQSADGNVNLPESSLISPVMMRIFKNPSDISFTATFNTTASVNDQLWRFEFNFILS
jgi:hypothetical protein